MNENRAQGKGDVRRRRGYYNSRAAAEFLGYELGTLYNKVSAGEISPTLRTRTGRLRFSLDDLERILAGDAKSASGEVVPA
jgi:predicted site-specific integrase-resolvase